MVNSEMFRQIAGQVEREPYTYAQCTYGFCGTHHCIAGWALVLSGIDFSDWPAHSGYKIASRAKSFLGLSEEDSKNLFNSQWKPRPGLTVPEALRLIADGASVAEVSAP